MTVHASRLPQASRSSGNVLSTRCRPCTDVDEAKVPKHCAHCGAFFFLGQLVNTAITSRIASRGATPAGHSRCRRVRAITRKSAGVGMPASTLGCNGASTTCSDHDDIPFQWVRRAKWREWNPSGRCAQASSHERTWHPRRGPAEGQNRARCGLAGAASTGYCRSLSADNLDFWCRASLPSEPIRRSLPQIHHERGPETRQAGTTRASDARVDDAERAGVKQPLGQRLRLHVAVRNKAVSEHSRGAEIVKLLKSAR